jgi:7-cyano-7-deazaguanine synthase in queuosine biosynthesis
MSDSVQNPTGFDPRLGSALGIHAMQLEKALRAYYEQHQKDGCGGCQLCKDAELAWSSMGRAR